MGEISYVGMSHDDRVPYSVKWTWSESCGNCGCVANWHAFDVPDGATMVALPERFPCKGFEFGGCPHNCETFVFCTPSVAFQPGVTREGAAEALVTWEKIKEARRMQNEDRNV